MAHTTIHTDFCVVGDGPAAFCAAVAAARHGVHTVLLQGHTAAGYALPLAGAPGHGNRETGLIEEMLLAALRNAADAAVLTGDVLAGFAAREQNLVHFTEVSDLRPHTADGRITAIDCRTPAGEITVTAPCYADCTADGRFALLVGAAADGGISTDCVLTVAEMAAGADHPDAVAYSAYLPDGTAQDRSAENPPYAIPYGCLCIRQIENLYFTGDRAAATAAICGQAVGTAAAIAKKYDVTPREVGRLHMAELAETLRYDDCFLPYSRREVSEEALNAELGCDDALAGDILNLRTGIDRCHYTYGEGDQGFTMRVGASVEYHMDAPVEVTRVRIVFDSDPDRPDAPAGMPAALAKVFALEVETPDGWEGILFENGNARRLVTAAVCRPVTGIRLTVMETWGAAGVHLLAFDFE